MAEPIDYAKPPRANEPVEAAALAFASKGDSIYLSPSWQVTPSGVRIVPRPPGVITLVFAIFVYSSFFTAFAAFLWRRKSWSLDAAVNLGVAIEIILTIGIAAIWIVSRRKNRTAPEWLGFDRTTGLIVLPAAGRTISLDDVVLIDFLTRPSGEQRAGELRLELRNGDCVGIVRTQRRRWATRLANELRVPLREVRVAKRGPPTIWLTPVGGARKRVPDTESM